MIMLPALLPAQQPVSKTNPMRVYMHYMPWFETPESIGSWGWHWTMNTRNPNNIADGKREIASHYYPLIGPYASRDRDVIEYHLLLMKLSGIDGILIDWYGIEGSNGDITNLLKSSDSIVSYTDDFGMEFGVVLEDRFATSKTDVKVNMSYLKNNYFNRDEHIRVGPGDDPLVCIFGPITFENEADWTEILPLGGEEVAFLPLWYESGDAGSNADGEFAWVYQDQTSHIDHLVNFYQNRAPTLDLAMGSAYPGFNDYYEEGGAGESYFYIPHYFGSTLSSTLDKAEEYAENIDMLQLVTFNDFGEGTIFEPTIETGFDYLERVQEYTGVSYSDTELKLVHRLFELRKDYKHDADTQESLDQASMHLRNLEIGEAAEILNGIPLGIGDRFPEEGGSEGKGITLFPNPYTGGGLTVRLEPEMKEISKMSVTDILGKEHPVEWSGPAPFHFRSDDPGLDPGIYFITIRGDDHSETVRLIVR